MQAGPRRMPAGPRPYAGRVFTARQRAGVALLRPVWYICKVLVGPGTPYLGPDTKKAPRAH